jgi:hypothetical protein
MCKHWPSRYFLVLLLVPAIVPAVAHAAAPPAALKDRPYVESLDAFANPERGFYVQRMSHRMGTLDGLRKDGVTLVLVAMDLRDFKDRDLSKGKLDELRSAFALARKGGLKVIFRAAYGFTGKDYRADPKDMGRITAHVKQLGAVFREERDVLWAVQAGLFGPWGEWHGSNWGDPPSLEARRAVLFALLDAVPSPVPVQVRRPMFIRDIFADEPGGSELTAESAHAGSRLSRTGWHNDALLSLPSDMGTYAQRGWGREREIAWCRNHGLYAPFGGETVGTSAKTPIEQVVRELEGLRATYLNRGYHPATLKGWRDSTYKGEKAYDHIERRLGYRLVATRLRYPPQVDVGGSLRFELELKNVGFAPPYLAREVAFVLERGDQAHRVTLKGVDVRRWTPEAGPITLRGEIRVPADAAAGRWRLGLHLADPSPRLSKDGRYAIRLASQGVTFDQTTGRNILTDQISVR